MTATVAAVLASALTHVLSSLVCCHHILGHEHRVAKGFTNGHVFHQAIATLDNDVDIQLTAQLSAFAAMGRYVLQSWLIWGEQRVSLYGSMMQGGNAPLSWPS